MIRRKSLRVIIILNKMSNITFEGNRILEDRITKMSAAELVTSEWIVFGLSIASFAIIALYVIHEVMQPLIQDDKWRYLT